MQKGVSYWASLDIVIANTNENSKQYGQKYGYLHVFY